MIGGFRSVLRVSVLQGSLLVIVIMIDAAKNAIVKAAFELWGSHVCEKRSKFYRLFSTAGHVVVVGFRRL